MRPVDKILLFIKFLSKGDVLSDLVIIVPDARAKTTSSTNNIENVLIV